MDEKQIADLLEEVKHLRKVNMLAIHIMTDKQNDKLISLLNKNKVGK